MAKSFFLPIFLSFLLAVSYVGTVPRLHIQSNPRITPTQPGFRKGEQDPMANGGARTV
jgi:hypothetical protein